MTDHPKEELTREEMDALRALPRETPPPPDLEERVVGELRQRGLISRKKPATPPWALAAMALAASLLIFMGGVFFGQSRGGPSSDAPPDPRFVLLLYEGEDFEPGPPDQLSERVREYSQWGQELALANRLLGGEKLKDGGRLLWGQEELVTAEDPPSVASGTTLGGFFLVAAADIEEAVSVAKSCPHLRYGGKILIRQIDPV